MATQLYQFTFTFPTAGPPSTPASLTTTFVQANGSGSQQYQEPNYNAQQPRRGGPNPSGGGGNYLVVSANDNVVINLQGPAGWSMPANSKLIVIVSQANSPGASQGFSPFENSYVYYALTGTPVGDGVTIQFAIPGVIQASANPGPGNYNRYELTVAFQANDSSGTAYYFADDPEMDVQGS